MASELHAWARTRRDEAIGWSDLSSAEQVAIALDPRLEMTAMLFRALAEGQLACAFGNLSERAGRRS